MLKNCHNYTLVFQHFSFGPPLETMKESCLNKLGFTKSKKKHMLKISAVYLIGNPEIPIRYPNWALVEQALLKLKFGYEIEFEFN